MIDGRRAFRAILMALFMGTVLAAGAATASDPGLRQRTAEVAVKQQGPGETPLVAIEGLRIEAAGSIMRIEIHTQTRVATNAFRLDNPDRLVIDLTGTRIAFSAAQLPPAEGFVTAIRYGEVAPGRVRMVFDLDRPVDVATLPIAHQGRGGAVRAGIAVTLSGKPDVAGAPETAQVPDGFDLRPSRFGERAGSAHQKGQRRTVVLDPGHGGIDPGAVHGNVREKDIVLAVAQRIRANLQRFESIDIVMTRESDEFVPLDRRVAIAEEASADLFISLHADAVDASIDANAVRGATVYVLSERASDLEAARLAEKENAADGTGDAPARSIGNETLEVRSILLDLLRRETADRAADFSGELTRQLARRISLSRSPRRAAAFRVLRQVATPSVLVELGYMSNPTDQELMRTPAWQTSVAEAISAAVVAHFSALERELGAQRGER